jgi:hypothetical protein
MNAAWAGTGSTPHASTTVVTNLVIAVQAVVLAVRVLPGSRSEAERYWGWFFGFMAVAALAGAVKHSYPPDPRLPMRFWGIVLSNTAAAAAAGFAQLATVETLIGRIAARLWLRRIVVAQVCAVWITSVLWPGFLPALVCTVAGLTPVLVAESVRSLRDRPGASAIASGFALTALGGFAYVLKVSPAPWLTYIDIAHLFTVASLALIYLGVLERAGPEFARDQRPAMFRLVSVVTVSSVRASRTRTTTE